MTICRADSAQSGAVTQISLPSGDRQLDGEMLQQRGDDTEIALAILEVDRIDLVRHRGRSSLARDRSLLEIAQRYVAPHVPAEIQQHGADSYGYIEQFGEKVMALDLRGQRIPGETEPFDKIFRMLDPVDV